MANEHVVDANNENWQQEVLQSEHPVLVDFWAPWCPPCKALSPTIDQLAAETAGKAKVVKVNVDDNQELAAEFGIRGIPALLIFNGGKEVERLGAGDRGLETLKQKLAAHSAAPAPEPAKAETSESGESGVPVDVTGDNWQSAVLDVKEPILVDFWAPWCPPCKALGPTIDQLAKDTAGESRVAKVNVDDAPEIAAKFGVRGIPALIIFKDGKEVERLGPGDRALETLKKKLAAHHG